MLECVNVIKLMMVAQSFHLDLSLSVDESVHSDPQFWVGGLRICDSALRMTIGHFPMIPVAHFMPGMLYTAHWDTIFTSLLLTRQIP